MLRVVFEVGWSSVGVLRVLRFLVLLAWEVVEVVVLGDSVCSVVVSSVSWVLVFAAEGSSPS